MEGGGNNSPLSFCKTMFTMKWMRGAMAMNKRLIYAEDAIDAVCEYCEYCEYFCNEKVIQRIKEIPSAQPIDVQEAYYRGKIDGIKECTTRLKK